MMHLVVDPNSVSRTHPDLMPVFLEDEDRIPFVGEPVLAVQPDDKGDGMAQARVEVVYEPQRMVYLRVDWDTFAWVEHG